VWQLAFGVLADDIKEACIDALILRFDTDVPELFYLHGKRQVVEVRAKKYSLWHIYLNNAYVGSIQYDSKQFNYHLVDNCLLTDDHVQKYSHDTTWGIKVDKGRYSMKKDIKFECDVCGQKQVVEVSVLHGGGTLQIMIDRFFYNGCRFSQWRMGNAM